MAMDRNKRRVLGVSTGVFLFCQDDPVLGPLPSFPLSLTETGPLGHHPDIFVADRTGKGDKGPSMVSSLDSLDRQQGLGQIDRMLEQMVDELRRIPAQG